jgi:hypothetical protein
MLETGMNTSVARIAPACVPLRVQLVKKARLELAECSSVSEFAPLCSPAADRPCNRRSSVRMMGAALPIVLASGNRPIASVEAPITTSVNSSTVLRPMRSPKWPRMTAPTGRAI